MACAVAAFTEDYKSALQEWLQSHDDILTWARPDGTVLWTTGHPKLAA